MSLPLFDPWENLADLFMILFHKDTVCMKFGVRLLKYCQDFLYKNKRLYLTHSCLTFTKLHVHVCLLFSYLTNAYHSDAPTGNDSESSDCQAKLNTTVPRSKPFQRNFSDIFKNLPYPATFSLFSSFHYS